MKQLTYRGLKYESQSGLLSYLLKKHKEELRTKKELMRDQKNMKATPVF